MEFKMRNSLVNTVDNLLSLVNSVDTLLLLVSWGEFCLEDRVTPGVYASTISMRDWVVETLDNNM